MIAAFTIVGVLVIIHMPDQEARARQAGVVTDRLPVLNQEVFIVRGSTIPQIVNLRLVLDRGDARSRRIRSYDRSSGETQLDTTPGIQMGR